MANYAADVRSLEQIDRWPVGTAAAAAVADGGMAVHGDADAVFALASVTKLLVAYGVLVAVEEGAIELDTAAGPPGSTVRHLLAHASGLAFDEVRVQAAPGARRIYSSAGYEMLADAVAEHTAIPFPEYLHEAVFVPLGMTSTALTGPAGHGGESTVADLVRFVAEVSAPTLLAAETVDDARSVQFAGLAGVLPGFGSQRPNDWGLGFEIKGSKRPHWTGTHNSARTFGHFGQSGTFVWIDPEVRLACVALTDRPFGDWAKVAWPDLSDAVLSESGT